MHIIPRQNHMEFNLWGYPEIIQVMHDHDLVLKPMVTWGSPILRTPYMTTGDTPIWMVSINGDPPIWMVYTGKSWKILL